jgi:hypothetical protein
MFTFQWTSLTVAAHALYNDLTYGLQDNYRYEHSQAWKPALATLLAFTYALYILAYPPPTSRLRKLSIALLAAPVTYAFFRQQELCANSSLNDTYGRFLYIWFANMSYEVTILEFSPPITKENDGWKSRLREAYKVLFARAHSEPEKGVQPRHERHSYCKTEFLLRHAFKACILYVLQTAYATFTEHYVVAGYVYGVDKGIFFRRLPDSLNALELWDRFDLTIYWCLINMWMYEAYHSAFAVLFVGAGLDSPREWSMTLFGSVAEAWSVRRYWGKHWHDYIYHSFSGHSKIVTRQWLGMRRGMLRRLIENTMVFGVSGLMHSAVRYAQHGDTGDYWVITFWYLGQMVPIIIEGYVSELWSQAKTYYGIKDSKWLGRAQKTVGYAWVFGFNMWSVSKYVHTRNDWADKAWRKKYARELEEWQSTKGNNTLPTVEDKSEL